MTVMGFGYDGAQPVPCSSRANKIAEAVLAVVETKGKLDKARDNCPNYTGQWESSDYYANELEAYYRAADELEAAIDSEKGLK